MALVTSERSFADIYIRPNIDVLPKRSRYYTPSAMTRARIAAFSGLSRKERSLLFVSPFYYQKEKKKRASLCKW